MTKYTHQERLQVLSVCADCVEGKLPLSLAEDKVRSLVPSYPVENLSGEISRLKNYLSGKGAYGWAYPATWAKALIELSDNSPGVIAALKTQQKLYYERDGKINMSLEKLLNDL